MTDSEQRIIPPAAVPEVYDKDGRRISPDITGYQIDGVWYTADGFRDQVKSPKDEVEKVSLGTEKTVPNNK